MISIVPLSQIAPSAVESLLDDAFGQDRRGRTAYRLRAGTVAIAALSFAAIDEGGALIGSLQSWPVVLRGDDGERYPLTLVGPVAVRPTLQRGGVGKALMQALINAAPVSRADALVMIGDPEYYGRFFGFCAKPTQGWRVPGPVDRRRLLARIAPEYGVAHAGEIVPRA